MRKIYFFLATLCLCMTSCKDNGDEPLQSSDMTGLWRVYQNDSGDKVPMPLWYCFSANSTVETFSYDIEDQKYYYDQGTYKVSYNWLNINLQKERIYMIAEVLRCVAEFAELQPEWNNPKFLITSVGRDEIEASVNNTKIRFVRVNALSSPWLAECSEPEITATKQNLASKWDLRSYYTLDGNNYNARFIQTPETQGMTFLESGEFADAQFWVNCIAVVERNADRLSANEGIYVQHKDCAWSVKDNTLFMVCASYEKVGYDNSGNEISRITVTPANPILVQFNIHMYTENWLTLYFPVEKYYFSFHRNASVNKASSVRTFQSSSMHPIQGNRSHSFNEQISKVMNDIGKPTSSHSTSRH